MIVNNIADVMEANLPLLALAETWDNSKPIRKTTAADLPFAIDHFRYFAGAIRAQEGSLSEIDHDTVTYHFHEPFGVVGQIIPWNFPLLMTVWKPTPGLAAGNCVVLKPAEQIPASILVFAELIVVLLPPGALNIASGFDLEAGKPVAQSNRITKIAITGETTGHLIMQYESQNLIPVTLELGGKNPNIFVKDVCAEDDDFCDTAIKGFVMFALIHERIYDPLRRKALAHKAAITAGAPLDPTTMISAQASSEQLEKTLFYMAIGKREGAQVLAGGFNMQPTVFMGSNKMRVFQKEIFGLAVSGTTFKDDEDALSIAYDTLCGLGAGVWRRSANTCYRFGRAVQAGRVWTDCFHAYPAHAAFGGYLPSGIGFEGHKMLLEQYEQTKNMLVSHSPKKPGFF